MLRFALLCLAACLSASPGFCQTALAVSGSSSGGGGTFTTSTMQFNMPAVTGAPYSAEQVQERVQTLADGTHITQKFNIQKMWRDSQGRTRTERTMGRPMGPNAPQDAQAPVVIEIRDPAAGSAYILDTQAKVAHRIALQPMPGRGSAAAGFSGAPGALGSVIATGRVAVTTSGQVVSGMATLPGAQAGTAGAMAGPAWASQANATDSNRPQFSREALEPQVIEGVLAQGFRTTTVYPVGYQGNDRPITVTSESWTATDLRMNILTKSSDPRSGDSTIKLTNISRADPDPTLFMPPADYSVVEETGTQVTIHYSIPPR